MTKWRYFLKGALIFYKNTLKQLQVKLYDAWGLFQNNLEWGMCTITDEVRVIRSLQLLKLVRGTLVFSLFLDSYTRLKKIHNRSA